MSFKGPYSVDTYIQYNSIGKLERNTFIGRTCAKLSLLYDIHNKTTATCKVLLLLLLFL